MRLFAAVQNNAPLYVYHSGYDKEEDVQACFSDLCGKALKRLYKSYVESPGLNYNDYVKALLALQLYYGLIRLFIQKGVKKYDQDHGVSIDDVSEKFKNIFDTLGLPLNNAVLSNEVDQIRLRKQKICKNWMYLVKFIKEDASVSTGSPNERNFFAHAGFESNVTQVKKDNDSLYVRYGDENIKHINTLKKWLIRSTG